MVNKQRIKISDTNESEPQRAPLTLPEAEGRSILPGEADDNAYRRIHPRYLRRMYNADENTDQKALIWHALKQWSRQYVDSLIEPFPYKRYFDDIADDEFKDSVERPKMMAARIAERFAEVKDPARNVFYYQDAEVNSGLDFGQVRNDGLGNSDAPVGGSEGNKDPNKWDKMVHPQQGKFEQNRPEEHHDWGGAFGGSGGDMSAPYEGTIKKNLKENDGSAGATASVKKGNRMSFFDDFVFSGNDNLELLFKTKTASRKKTSKIVKMSDLDCFLKVGNDLLIHKSDRDLWAMETDDNGDITISRLFEKDCL